MSDNRDTAPHYSLQLYFLLQTFRPNYINHTNVLVIWNSLKRFIATCDRVCACGRPNAHVTIMIWIALAFAQPRTRIVILKLGSTAFNKLAGIHRVGRLDKPITNHWPVDRAVRRTHVCIAQIRQLSRVDHANHLFCSSSSRILINAFAEFANIPLHSRKYAAAVAQI